MPLPIEASYPLTFRQTDAQALGDHLKHHNSVTLIGMKRVGISNFLRFFLYHPQVAATYVKNGYTPLFIPVDLNDLVARELPAFWTLTLKRLVDAIETSDLPEKTKASTHKLFSESIQLQDTFFTLDSIKSLLTTISGSYYPVLFFVRFDRLADVFTPEAFANLQGVKDAAHQKHSFVFTSHRPLHELAPKVFKRSSLSVFTQDMYLKPAQPADMRIILKTFEDRYDLKLPETLISPLLEITGGHVQYLQLTLIKLNQAPNGAWPKTKTELFNILAQEEEINLQSEELFAGLTKNEQITLLNCLHHQKISPDEQKPSHYLWSTGLVTHKTNRVFSPLLETYIQSREGTTPPATDFTKKENLLFNYLKDHLNELCERDDIIHAVWPEQEELGVSDWAIDRLVARVRAKLKSQNSPYKIITVVTRGYKLVG